MWILRKKQTNNKSDDESKRNIPNFLNKKTKELCKIMSTVKERNIQIFKQEYFPYKECIDSDRVD